MALFKAKKVRPEAKPVEKAEEKRMVEAKAEAGLPEKPAAAEKPAEKPVEKPAEKPVPAEMEAEAEAEAKSEAKSEKKAEAKPAEKPTPAAPPAAAPAVAPAIGVVSTPVDEVCELLEKAKDMQRAIEDIAKELKLTAQQVEAIGKILAAREVAEVIYPVSPLAKPALKLLAPKAKTAVERVKGDKLLSSYDVSAAGVPANIEIWDIKKETRPVYDITIVKASAYTEVLLNYVREELAREVPVLTEEITDPKLLAKLKERFHSAAKNAIEKYLPMIDASKKEMLSGILLNRIYGLGDVELLMADDWLEEIAVNTSVEPIGVYHKKLGWLKTNLRLTSEEEIYNYASQIGRKAGRDITLLSPILDAPLITGDRATASLFPISSMGNTITIRRFARKPWTITQFMDPSLHTLSSEMAAFLWLAVEYEMNVLVTGGTASGKTSTLNVVATFIPQIHRIISAEDTREVILPSYMRWNWVPLVTRGPNPEGKGEVSMLDLMVAAMRMRPDRIIVGEVRRRREAEVMFEAMHTGHSVYCTLHADTATQAIRRLTEPPIEIPMTELQVLQLIATQYRDRRTGIRRIYEITELVPSPTAAGEVSLNTVYRWRPRTDAFEKINESARVVGDISMHTGMTLDEIRRDIENKRIVLEWALEHQLISIDQVGEVVVSYYKDRESVVNGAKKDLPPEKVLLI